MWEHEYQLWEKYYPQGKTILDVGADPESVEFFKKRGQTAIPIGDAYGQHLDGIKIDVDGSELGMVLETHYPVKWKLLYRFPGTQTRIWRLERRTTLRDRRIRIAHWIRTRVL